MIRHFFLLTFSAAAGLNISASADAAVPVARAGGPEVASFPLPFANASAPILVKKLRH